MNGEQTDLEDLYDQHFSKIYNFFFYRLLHRETAEDLTGQVFLKAAEHWASFDPRRAKPGTWLHRIAQNTLIDFYRARRPCASLSDEAGEWANFSVSFEEQYEQIASPGRRRLYAALAALPERDRTFLYHKYFLGESYHEIAAQYQIGESTLASALQRAKAKLRAALNEDDEGSAV